jgi:hypothetical protein
MNAPTDARIKETADKMIATTKLYVERAIAPILDRVAAAESVKSAVDQLGARLSTVELRCGALALLLGRSNPEGVKDFEKLLARLDHLEAKADALRYCGVWTAGREYIEGNFVTDHGSVWAARRTTTSRPGADDSWTLAVKKGDRGDSR